MTKGFNRLLLLSLAAHIALIALVSQFATPKLPVPNVKQKPIKSYLYIPPKPIESEEVTATTPAEANKTEESAPDKGEEKKALSSDKPTAPDSAPVEETELVSEPEVISEAESTQEPQPQSKVDKLFENKEVQVNQSKSVKKFNPYKALSNLSKQNAADLAEEEAFLNYRKRSFSVMDGEPELVPERPLEEKRTVEERTSTASPFNSITKNDNGTCTLNQDLSHMGAGNWQAKQSFACGESQFDKSYRLHMQKVIGKLKKDKKAEVGAPLR